MFGRDFGDHWHSIPGVPGLELSGDLRFRGPRGLRKLRHDHNGRPYVSVERRKGQPGGRHQRVHTHRAVMSVVEGRELGRGEFVCHRDDDKSNNWPGNLYLGDRLTNAADSLRNGGRLVGERHPFAKLRDQTVREIRSALGCGVSGAMLAGIYGVDKSTISRIKSGSRRKHQ